jgi:hypothetical protein
MTATHIGCMYTAASGGAEKSLLAKVGILGVETAGVA